MLDQERLHRGMFGFAMVLFGLFTAINLLTLSQAINATTGEQVSADLFVLSLLSLAIATLSRHYALLRVVVLLEKATCAVRLRVLDRLRHIELPTYEAIGREAIYDSLAADTRAISSAGVMITKILILVMRLLAVLLALLFIAPVALFITLGALALLAMAHNLLQPEAAAPRNGNDHGLFHGMGELLRGIKEVKLHRARGDELLATEVDGVLSREWHRRVTSGRRIAASYVLAEALTLLLAGLLVFLLPNVYPAFTDAAVRAAVVALCLPTALLRDAPLVGMADDALRHLHTVEQRLQTATTDTAPAAPPQRDFRTLEFREVFFRYTDARGEGRFSVGPLSFTLEAGTITFIVGGNGSGKSTLMKLLTGLYPPFAGEILLDGEPVRMADHRELFAAIFTDFHLFDRLYDQEDLNPAQVEGLLRQLDMDDRVRYQDGAFSTLSLSSAQRKRLAMVVALLEDRPVYVLDEWAADQDPVLREQYYRTLLPTLQARGKTVVAVTHDDRFFGLADRVLKLDYGRLVAS